MYMAPEVSVLATPWCKHLPDPEWPRQVLQRERYSKGSDVWSFGVTLWEMFSFGATPALEGCQDFFSCFQRQQQDFRVRGLMGYKKFE